MRRMFLAVSGVALGLVLMTPATVVRAEQAQDAAVLDKTMKAVGPAFGAARKAIGGGLMADAVTSGEALSQAFVDTEAFFKSHSKADGVGPYRFSDFGRAFFPDPWSLVPDPRP